MQDWSSASPLLVMSMFEKKRVEILLLGILGITLLSSLAWGKRPQEEKRVYKAPFLIPISGEIDDGLFQSVKRRVERAKFEGADLIVFEIDSYGGLLNAGYNIADHIFDLTIHTVAYVPKKAISAGALISLACRDIVMKEEAELGDCAPIAMTTEGIQELGEKMQSPIRTKFRKFAERNLYPIALAEAMVTKELEVLQVEFRDGTIEYMDSEEYDRLPLERKSRVKLDPPQIVCKKGELLTIHAKEALNFGFNRFLVKEREEIFQHFTKAKEIEIIRVESAGIPSSTPRKGVVRVIELPILWSESLVRFIQSYSFIFFILGIILLYIEFKTPGFGVFGILGILCFAILFGSNFLSGLAEFYEIFIFVVGVLLLGIEIFLIPGFGITGILGITLILVGFYLASLPFVVPDVTSPLDMERLERWVRNMGISLLGAILIMYAISRFLPKTPIFRRIILQPEGEGGIFRGTAAAAEHRFDFLAGMVGIALTDLRPAGKAEFAENRVDVMAEGAFIKKGAKVRVLKIRGNRIVVTEDQGK